MSGDEQKIRQLIKTWITASKAGDTKTVLNLMTDDVVFMVAGQEPFGKSAFEAASEQQKDMNIEGNSQIKEINILGNWAYIRTYLKLTIEDGGKSVNHSGYTLSILKKEKDGNWRIARDANLLTVDK